MGLTAKQEFDRIGKALALGSRTGRLLSHFFADRIEEGSLTMTISSWLSWPNSHSHARRQPHPNPAAPPRKARLFLEQLETRVTPSFGLSTLGSSVRSYGSQTDGHQWRHLVHDQDSSGNLYGTTLAEAPDDGTVFELAKGSSTITALASFNGTDGANPYGRPDHGQQRQSLRHNATEEAPAATARFSSWPRAAAPSPPWPRSTAANGANPCGPGHGQQRQSVRHH